MAQDASTPTDSFLNQRLDYWDWGRGIGTRILNACRNDNIITVADLVEKTEADLLRLPKFGRRSLAMIKQFLAERGLALAHISDENFRRRREAHRLHRIREASASYSPKKT